MTVDELIADEECKKACEAFRKSRAYLLIKDCLVTTTGSGEKETERSATPELLHTAHGKVLGVIEAFKKIEQVADFKKHIEPPKRKSGTDPDLET